MTASEWSTLLILAVLWGGSFFFVEIAVDSLPPLTIVAVRVGLAAIALYGVCLVSGRKIMLTASALMAFLGMSVLNNVVPFTLIVWAQTQISSSLASILNATTPLFTIVVAHFLTADEKMTVQKAIGVFAGFFGVTIMFAPQLLSGFDATVLGQLAALGAALSYAFSGVFGRRFNRMGMEPVTAATGQLAMSSLILIPAALLIDTPWLLAFPSEAVIFSLGGLALLSTALAYILFFRLLATAGASNLLLVTFLIPVTAILLGVFVLDERLLPQQIAGMLVIGAGLLIIDGRVWKKKPRGRALAK
ncbi:MAG: DMT family transporter [Phycisphaerales bacterium]|nr:DMT family transporter [Phycisphaerales bacterium]